MPSRHTSILKLGQLLGYLTAEAGGCCHGFTIKWLEALLLEDEKAFDKRITRLSKYFSKNQSYIRDIENIKQKVKQHLSLTAQEKELLDITAFYESMTLFQTPHYFSKVFNQPLTQANIDDISLIASSSQTVEQNGLTKSWDVSGIYETHQEIEKYIQKLSASINTLELNKPSNIGFTLSSHNHSIGIAYQPKTKTWSFLDINRWPYYNFKTTSSEKIAKEIAFAFKITSGLSFSIFNTSLITLKNQENLPELIAQINKIHPELHISKETALSHEGIDILEFAAQFGDIELIKQLAKLGINLDATNEKGQSAAYIAAQNGHVEALIKLKALGADLNLQDTLGATPAMIAAKLGHVKVLQTLHALGADLNIAGKDGSTPIHYAAQAGQVAVIATLNEMGLSLHTPKDGGFLPMHIAAYNGHADVVEKLHELGESLNVPVMSGLCQSPAQLAAEKGHLNVLCKLHDLGVDLLTPTQHYADHLKEEGFCGVYEDDETPLEIALRQDDLSMVKKLIDWGADVNLQIGQFTTALHSASFFNSPGVIDTLIQAGAELNVENIKGKTPASIAAEQGSNEALLKLIEHGVTLDKPNKQNLPPLFIAIINTHPVCVETIMRHLDNQSPTLTFTTDELKAVFDIFYTGKIHQRLDTLINAKIKAGEDKNKLSITAYDFASVIDNQNVLSVIKNAMPTALSKIKASLTQQINGHRWNLCPLFFRSFQNKRRSLRSLSYKLEHDDSFLTGKSSLSTLLSEWKTPEVLSTLKTHRNRFFSPHRDEVKTSTEMLIDRIEHEYGHMKKTL
jgi:ankyrin repeat protein